MDRNNNPEQPVTPAAPARIRAIAHSLMSCLEQSLTTNNNIVDLNRYTINDIIYYQINTNCIIPPIQNCWESI